MEEEHLDAGQLARLRRGELSSAEVLEVTTHLANCETCGEPVDLDAESLSLVDRLVESSADEHLEFETLAALVDGTLPFDERERVEAHLEICDRCREDVDDLRTVAASMRPARDGSRMRFLLAVAAIVAAAIIALLLFRPAAHNAPPTERPPIVKVTPPTETVMTTTAPPMKAEWAALVGDALKSGRIAMPKTLRDITAVPEAMRGPSETRKDSVSPAETVIESNRPTFRWPKFEGSESVVFVYRGETELAVSDRLRTNRWTPPKPLPRGVPLVWQVELRRPDGSTLVIPSPPDPPAMFRIVDETSLDEIATAKRLHPEDHLLLGVLYAHAGMKPQAIDELRRETAKREEAAKLLASIERWH